jgi:iron complex transport system ATP-binding protein
MVRPGLLILDEPAAGLDPVAREMFLARLAALMASAGSPVILYVTHHVEEAIPSFTHALLLGKGRIQARGPLRECLDEKNLGRLFGHPVRLSRREGRYLLTLRPRGAGKA